MKKRQDYYKLIDEEHISLFMGGSLIEDGRRIAPPTHAALTRAGYYPLECDPLPAYNEETEYIRTVYTLDGGIIRAEHTVAERR